MRADLACGRHPSAASHIEAQLASSLLNRKRLDVLRFAIISRCSRGSKVARYSRSGSASRISVNIDVDVFSTALQPR